MKKIIIGLVAAILCTLTVAVIPASANGNGNQSTWHVYYYSPYAMNPSQSFSDTATSQLTSAIVNCTALHASSTSYVQYNGHYEFTNSYGLQKVTTFFSQYFTNSTGGGLITYVHNVPAGCQYFVDFYLHDYYGGNPDYDGNIAY
jgi:hypothetical protein